MQFAGKRPLSTGAGWLAVCPTVSLRGNMWTIFQQDHHHLSGLGRPTNPYAKKIERGRGKISMQTTIQTDIFVLQTLWMIFHSEFLPLCVCVCVTGFRSSLGRFRGDFSVPLRPPSWPVSFLLSTTNLYTHFRFHGYFATEISSNIRANRAKIWYSTASETPNLSFSWDQGKSHCVRGQRFVSS